MESGVRGSACDQEAPVRDVIAHHSVLRLKHVITHRIAGCRLQRSLADMLVVGCRELLLTCWFCLAELSLS